MGVSKAQTGTPAQQQDEEQTQIPKTRDEMLLFLQDHGVKNPGRYSKPELEALVREILVPSDTGRGARRDPCLGLSALNKPDLREISELLGIPDYLKMTNGLLMVNIRHTIESLEDQKVGIGRLKSLTMREAVLNHQGYCLWAATQLGGHPHHRLKELVCLHRMYFRYYPQPKAHAPEPTAKETTPPPESWPQEPEEEVRPAPRAKAMAKSSASAASGSAGQQPKAAPQLYSLVQEGEVEEEDIDEGYISDSPPAWEEKKTRVSTTPQPSNKRK
jgi:hypothetical protein